MNEDRGINAYVCYLQTEQYAKEHNETYIYYNSEHINLKCKDCIENAIDMFYDGSRLASDEALKYVLGQHTPERVIFIVATSIMRRSLDGRISSENKEFAEKIMFAIRQKYGDGERTGAVIKSHAGLLNLFAREVRESYIVDEILDDIFGEDYDNTDDRDERDRILQERFDERSKGLCENGLGDDR